MSDVAQTKGPEELSDALARITKAKTDYGALRVEIEGFLYEYWGGMFDGREPGTGNFIVTLPHADDMVLPATTRVLAGQINRRCEKCVGLYGIRNVKEELPRIEREGATVCYS